MKKNAETSLRRLRETVLDLRDEIYFYGEMQTDNEGLFGPNTCFGKLEAVSDEIENLWGENGKIKA